MKPSRNLARVTIASLLGAFLLTGCGGGGGGGEAMPAERGEQQKQARIAAYGKTGVPSGKPGSGPAATPDASGQAAARRRAGGGSR